MMKIPALLLVPSLALMPLLACAQVKEEDYEIRGGCKANSRLSAPADGPAELEYRIEDASNPQHGFGSFKKLVKVDGELLAPLMGFNLCDSFTQSGPVAVTISAAGDYQRISLSCGGTWKPIEGSATLTLQTSTRKVVQVKVDLAGAYGNGSWHTGVVKSTLDSFSCQSEEYVKTVAALFDASSVKVVKGSISKGAFTKTP